MLPDLMDERQGKQGIVLIVLVFVLVAAALFFTGRFLVAPSSDQNASAITQSDLLTDADTPAADSLLVGATETPSPPTITATPEPIIVYISGAVMQPDVYEVQPDARVIDVLNAAGGFAHDADRDNINLAAHIRDAQHIHVPRIGEPSQPDSGAPDSSPSPDTPAAPDDSNETHASSRSDSTTSAIININTASAAELATLPNIGEARARDIINYRDAHGQFTTVESLQDVPGIGPVVLEKIRPFIRIDDE